MARRFFLGWLLSGTAHAGNPAGGGLVLALFLIFLPGPASAQYHTNSPYTRPHLGLGFGARAVSMGGAFIGVAEGVSAVGYNPAGLARIKQLEFSLGANARGQSIHYPAGSTFIDETPYFYSATAYDFRLSGTSFEHAGAAFRVRLGKRSFVIGLSCHRELDLTASYSFAHQLEGFIYLPDGTTAPDSREEVRDWKFNHFGYLDVYATSLAFRVAKNVFFGLNLKFRQGKSRGYELFNTSFAYLNEGTVYLSGQRALLNEYSERYSRGVSADLGTLWVTRFFSVGAVFQSGYDPSYLDQSSTYLLAESDSSGRTSMEQGRGWGGFDVRPWSPRLGIGMAVRPGKPWTLAADFILPFNPYTGSDVSPGIFKQFRTGVEYVISGKTSQIALRGGWSLGGSDFIRFRGGEAWISAFTFGLGLAWRDIALDIGTQFHSVPISSHYDIEERPVRRTYWDALVSLTYRLGKRP